MAAGGAAAGGVLLRVGTFNIRNSAADDGPHAWPLRRGLLFETVREFAPDVIGLQEVLADQQDDLAAAFADYDSVAVHRDDGRRAGEAVSIFFRRARFTPIASDTFWLSPTPTTPGPPAWDAACSRICTWAVLRDHAAEREIVVFNTHFDHVGEVARLESAGLVARTIATFAQPAVLLGDFNSTEDGPVYAALLNEAAAAGRPLTDAHRAVHPTVRPDEATVHWFSDAVGGLRIDWTFCGEGLRPVASRIGRRTAASGGYASDHDPVWTCASYQTEATGLSAPPSGPQYVIAAYTE